MTARYFYKLKGFISHTFKMSIRNFIKYLYMLLFQKLHTRLLSSPRTLRNRFNGIVNRNLLEIRCHRETKKKRKEYTFPKLYKRGDFSKFAGFQKSCLVIYTN